METEQKDSIEHLMYHMQKNNYKEMCDQIKVAMLDKFINLAEVGGYGGISTEDLKSIRNAIDEMRAKDKEAETLAIVHAIDNLISRGIPDGEKKS